MDVIGLLQNKKRCLQHFLDVSKTFSAEAEQGELAGLKVFEDQRENTIKTLGLIDQRLTDAVRALPLGARTATLSEQVRQSMAEEMELVAEISKVDERIVVFIEREKTRLQKEMNELRKSQEIAGRFKSTWVSEAGEELDQKL